MNYFSYQFIPHAKWQAHETLKQAEDNARDILKDLNARGSDVKEMYVGYGTLDPEAAGTFPVCLAHMEAYDIVAPYLSLRDAENASKFWGWDAQIGKIVKYTNRLGVLE